MNLETYQTSNYYGSSIRLQPLGLEYRFNNQDAAKGPDEGPEPGDDVPDLLWRCLPVS